MTRSHSETDLQTQVMRLFQLAGWTVWRHTPFNPGARVKLSRAVAAQLGVPPGNYVQVLPVHETQEGAPDLIARHPDGRGWELELKSETGEQSPAQRIVGERLKRTYRLIRTLEEAKNILTPSIH